MTEFFIAEIAPPEAASDEPSWAVRQYVAMDVENFSQTLGMAESYYSDTLLLESLADQTYGIKYYLLAVEGSKPDWPNSPHGLPSVAASAAEAPAPLPVIGSASVILPLRDNLSSAHFVDVYVREPYRRQGIGSTLLAEIERLSRSHERSEVVGNSRQPYVTQLDDQNAVLTVAGDGALDRRMPMHQFRLRHGFVLGQTQRLSECPLPVPEIEVPSSGDYEIRALPYGFPSSLYAALARLRVGMSADAPSGEVDAEAEDWDAERVAALQKRTAAAGIDQIAAIAIERATGELVAYTEVLVHQDRPASAHQGDTYVAREYRGHGLGLAVKAACYQVLPDVAPKVKRVITLNASENDHMWSINRALGFREAGTNGLWIKRLLPQEQG